MKDNIIEFINLEKKFNGIKALDKFSGSVQKGDIVGIIGPNGAGKTTLFNIITNYFLPDKGVVLFKKKDITGASPHKITTLGISRTFQDLRIIKQITAYENVMLAFKNQPGECLRNVFFKSKKVKKIEKENKKKALELLSYAGLVDKAHELGSELSYGQQKILTIICCLATNGDLILLDEPVAGLSPVLIDKMVSIILDLPKHNKTVVLIEHNMELVSQICDKVIALEAGKIICEGGPDSVRNDPRVIESFLN